MIGQYAGAEVVWCQEEPKNMGAHAYIKPRLATALRELGEPAGISSARPLRYVGRTASASVGAHALLLPLLMALRSVPRCAPCSMIRSEGAPDTCLLLHDKAACAA